MSVQTLLINKNENTTYIRNVYLNPYTPLWNQIVNVEEKDGFTNVVVELHNNRYCACKMDRTGMSTMDVYKYIIKKAFKKPYDKLKKEIIDTVTSKIFDYEIDDIFKDSKKRGVIVPYYESIPYRVLDLKMLLPVLQKPILSKEEQYVFEAVNAFWKNVIVEDSILIEPKFDIQFEQTFDIKDIDEVKVKGKLGSYYRISVRRYIEFKLLDTNYLMYFVQTGYLKRVKNKNIVISSLKGGVPACFSSKKYYKGQEMIMADKKDVISYPSVYAFLNDIANKLYKNASIIKNPLYTNERER